MDSAEKPETLADVFADLWAARLYILTGSMAALLAAAAFLIITPPYYRAQMIVAPASPVNGAEVSSLLADENLFALRFLAQRMGGANTSDFTRFENTFAGPSVAEFLLKDDKIKDGLIYEGGFETGRGDPEWSAARLAEFVARRVRIEPVGATSLRRLSFLHPDRQFGAYFLQTLHRTTDELIRQKIRQEASQRVRYLQQASEQTNNPEHRRALTTLLMEQERLLMLVSLGTPYAANVVEPPAAARRPAWPDPLLVVPVFVFAGALLGFVLFSAFAAARAARSAAAPRARRWFRTDSRNSNMPPVSARQQHAAE